MRGVGRSVVTLELASCVAVDVSWLTCGGCQSAMPGLISESSDSLTIDLLIVIKL